MSNYNKATNFAVKDTLTSGDPDKVVAGAEIDNEFNSIASAVTSKADKVAAATTDNFAALDANGNIKDSGNSDSSFVPAGFGVPTGSVTAFAATTAPSGWIECDGRAINRSANSNLFDVIGVTFGNGDGSTTFNVPDLRGEFVRGWDDGRGVDSGRGLGTDQAGQIESHNHEVTARRNSGDDPFGQLSGARVDTSTTFQVGTTDFGGDETRPRNIALMYIIKT